MDPELILDMTQALALRGVIGAAHPYKAVLPNRWSAPKTPKGDDPAFYPKPSIGTQPGKTGTPKGTTDQDWVESPQPNSTNSKHDDLPKEDQHAYHLVLDEIQMREYPGKYTIFGGIEQDIQRAIRIPYRYYMPTGNGNAILVKEYVTVLYEGGAGH